MGSLSYSSLLWLPPYLQTPDLLLYLLFYVFFSYCILQSKRTKSIDSFFFCLVIIFQPFCFFGILTKNFLKFFKQIILHIILNYPNFPPHYYLQQWVPPASPPLLMHSP